MEPFAISTKNGIDPVYVTGPFSNNAFRITPDGVITQIIDAVGAIVQDDQLHRESEFSGGSAYGQGGLLEERGSEAPLVSCGPFGHRAAIK